MLERLSKIHRLQSGGLTRIIKMVRKMVKGRYEWAHDDYSQSVANLPMAQLSDAVPSGQSLDDLLAGDAA